MVLYYRWEQFHYISSKQYFSLIHYYLLAHLELQNIGPAKQYKARFHNAISKYVVDPYGQSGSRLHSTYLPTSDTKLDARKLHNIFQFDIAVQQILPSK